MIETIPTAVLNKFLSQRRTGKLLLVAVSGPHAYGFACRESPLELRAIHVEPTENLVGITRPSSACNWVGEFEGLRIDYSSYEIGQALKRLLRGDGTILERIMAPRQVLKGDDLRGLQKVTRGVICRRVYAHYRNFARGVLRDHEEPLTVRHLLCAYRSALTGAHLLNTGKVLLDLFTLAQKYGFSQIEQLVRVYQKDERALLEENNPWINRMVKLHLLLETAFTETSLRRDPDNPKALEEYLLDMRRRFFDAPTLQEG